MFSHRRVRLCIQVEVGVCVYVSVGVNVLTVHAHMKTNSRNPAGSVEASLHQTFRTHNDEPFCEPSANSDINFTTFRDAKPMYR